MIDHDDLKPCPFCGRGASTAIYHDEADVYSAACRKCGAEIEGESMEEVVTAWNRRSVSAMDAEGAPKEIATDTMIRLRTAFDRVKEFTEFQPEGAGVMGGHDFAVKSIMRRYRVRAHHLARSQTGKPQYAVFSGAPKVVKIVHGPCAYREAEEARESLIARDILEYFGVSA